MRPRAGYRDDTRRAFCIPSIAAGIPRFVLLLLVIVSLLVPLVPISAQETLTIATWNLRGYPEKTPQAETWLSHELQAISPAILCVEEIANQGSVDKFLSHEKGFTEVAFSDSQDGQDNAIFTKAEVAIADLPDPKGFQHPTQAAYFSYKGFDAVIIAVHLSWTNKEAREKEKHLLHDVVADMEKVDPDVIVAGDFNTEQDGIEELATATGTVVMVPKGQESVGTTHAGHQYDHFLISPDLAKEEAIGCRIEVISGSDLESAKKVSDHLPVVAEFRVDEEFRDRGDGTSGQPSVPHGIVTAPKTDDKASSGNAELGMVYIAGEGKKYHRLGCRFLKNAGVAIPLSEAKSKGYAPCKVCKPWDPLRGGRNKCRGARLRRARMKPHSTTKNAAKIGNTASSPSTKLAKTPQQYRRRGGVENLKARGVETQRGHQSMQSLKYPRGSEWRRWDLHVHTPFSALNNGFGADFDTFAKILFEKAVERDIAAIGITDYFSIDGYEQLRSLMADDTRLRGLGGADFSAKVKQILLLPNIEFRTAVMIKRRNGEESRVNFHVIFSDDIRPKLIKEHFLQGLKFTAESAPNDRDNRWPVTRTNLEDLGRKLKHQHPVFQDKSDVYIGMMNAVVSHEAVTEVLQDQASRFRGRFLVVVPADEDLSECSWNGAGHLMRKLLIQKSHMLFSSNAGTRDFGLGRKHKNQEEFLQEFKSLKPCIHGSDAHSFDSLFEPAGGRYLWIKADPTFQGLQQVLHVPDERVRIGENHPSLAREKEKATKYFDSLHFERTEQADPGEIWFSDKVPLNHGLVAIIGNKGTGKSALADILGLLGNTSNSENFSFLHKDRFLEKRARLGGMFRARLTWHSGLEAARLLCDTVDSTTPELVKYIPQNFLESICSELKRPLESQFYSELMEVIFSHVTDADRLGKETLPELIDYITSEKEDLIAQVTDELRAVNAAIATHEDQLAPDHRKAVEAQLEQRRAELKAHHDSKPAEVAEPSRNAEEQATLEPIKQELANLVEQWGKLDREIADAEEQVRDAVRRIAAADRLLRRIDNVERQMDRFHEESLADGESLGIDTRQLVTLTLNRKPISDAREKADHQNRMLQQLLDFNAATSLVEKRKHIQERTEATRGKLDEPNRRHQEYLYHLAEWQKRHDVLSGSPSEPASVVGLESRLSALDRLPAEIGELKKRRLGLVHEIFQTKQELLDDYQRLYSAVQSFIVNHPVAQRQKALEFSARLVVDGFESSLLDMINQRRKGSFQGEEGGKRLTGIVENSDFSTTSTLEVFLKDVQEHLEIDKRPEGGGEIRLSDQLLQGKTPADVYDFLYGLRYLKPQFELRWQGKSLDQLSQGERGSLLLVFYLLIDKRDVPLIIDQPEVSLDNQSIVAMLVPAIRHAKKERQIILVTHNPNLAVVCDADQVIHAHLDKAHGNRVTYTSGSIEEPVVTKLIVDVLEGTKPAFDLRDARYEILERSPSET